MLLHVLGAVLILSGVSMALLYLLLVSGVIGERDGAREAGGMAGFGVALLVAGLLTEGSLLRRRGRDIVGTLRFPPIWFSAATFTVVVAAGGIVVWQGVATRWEPFLAVAGVTALFLAFARLATRWAPGNRAPGYAVLGATAWGMLGATSIAIVMQLIIAITAIAGAAAGLYVTDPELLAGFLDRVGGEGTLDGFSGEIASTATVSIGIVGMYAVVAPLTEEFTKFLGVVIALRHRELTPYTVFVAGVCSGLGFAVVETLGYSLAAGEGWPFLMALRGPVALVHVTGTTLVAFGWYLQRTRGGFPLVWYYIVAVLVHGAWNGLTVSMLVSASAVDEGVDPSGGMVVGMLVALGLLATVLAACLAWTIANARRWGRAYQRSQPPPSMLAPITSPPFNRVSVYSGSAPGEV